MTLRSMRRRPLARILAAVLLVATLPGCRFPRSAAVQYPVEAERATGGATGLLKGTLVVVGRCLLVEIENNPKTLPVWPFGTSFRPSNGGGVILAADGRTVLAEVGGTVFAGGGEIPFEFAQELAGNEVPRDCGEPITYWHAWEILAEEP